MTWDIGNFAKSFKTLKSSGILLGFILLSGCAGNEAKELRSIFDRYSAEGLSCVDVGIHVDDASCFVIIADSEVFVRDNQKMSVERYPSGFECETIEKLAQVVVSPLYVQNICSRKFVRAVVEKITSEELSIQNHCLYEAYIQCADYRVKAKNVFLNGRHSFTVAIVAQRMIDEKAS